MNLALAAERVAAIDRSRVALRPERCLHAGSALAACQACAALCPTGAIHAGRPPVLDEAACETCLACLPVCPTGAFSADDDVAPLLDCAARVEATVLELLCQRHPNAEVGLPEASAAIRVRGCLAGLGAAAYVALAALGVEQVLVRTDACAECAWAALSPQVAGCLEQARRLLAPWGLGPALRSVGALPGGTSAGQRPVWEAANPPLSRRDVFRLASKRGQVALARALNTEASAAARQPARERQRVLAALAHLRPRPFSAEPAPGPAGPGYATVTVSAACTACGTCARACPTGALQLHHDAPDRFRLTLQAAACIGCELCRHVCGTGAVTVDPAAAWEAVFGADAPITLRAGRLVRCARCRIWMAARPEAVGPGADLCPVCHDRRLNPFGARPLPGLPRTRR